MSKLRTGRYGRKVHLCGACSGRAVRAAPSAAEGAQGCYRSWPRPAYREQGGDIEAVQAQAWLQGAPVWGVFWARSACCTQRFRRRSRLLSELAQTSVQRAGW